MESEAIRVLVILMSVVMITFLIAGVIAAVVVIRLVKKVTTHVDKAGAITDNLMTFSAGISRLGMPVMASRILFGLARRAMSKH